MTALNITTRPATVSLSSIRENYRNFLYYERIDGVFVPCWTWDERNYYIRPDGCECALGDGILDLIEKYLDRYFANRWDAAAKEFFSCAPAQVRDYVESLERYGSAYLSNYFDDEMIEFEGEELDYLPDNVLRWIIAASKAVIELRDAADAFAAWQEYSHGIGSWYPAHNHQWEYEASNEMLAIVRTRCTEILTLREQERKRREREERAKKPLTSTPFKEVLAHLL